jgi:hypothetical protein
MRRPWTVLAVIALGAPGVAVSGGARAGAATPPPPVSTAGNGIYNVYTQTGGSNPGLFTIGTGARNPYGGGLDLLQGNGQPGTSYISVKVDNAAPPFVLATLPNSVGGSTPYSSSVEPVGTTGFRTTYSQYPVSLTVVVNAVGSTFEDSTVVVSATVTNVDAANTHTVQLRDLLDVAVGKDDGPVLQPPTGAALTTAQTLTGAQLGSYRLLDNDQNPSPPTFAVDVKSNLASPVGGAVFACWPEAARFPFDYTPPAARDVTSTHGDCSPQTGGDSAVLAYSNVSTLGPNETTAFTFSIRSTQLAPIRTVLTASPARAGLAGLQLTLSNVSGHLVTPAGVAVVGRQILFSSGGRTVCSAVTNDSGTATCSGTAPLSALFGGGYDASFAGDATYLPSSAHGTVGL